MGKEDPGVTAQGKELIKEVWEVIARKYVDVRFGGFDQQRWAQLRDDALAKPLRDKDSVERSASLLQSPEPTAIALTCSCDVLNG